MVMSCTETLDHDLELTIQCNRKVVNFLDVILNLKNSTYHPYLKDNNKIQSSTVHNQTAAKLIELRLSQSANEEIFKTSVT